MYYILLRHDNEPIESVYLFSILLYDKTNDDYWPLTNTQMTSILQNQINVNK